MPLKRFKCFYILPVYNITFGMLHQVSTLTLTPFFDVNDALNKIAVFFLEAAFNGAEFIVVNSFVDNRFSLGRSETVWSIKSIRILRILERMHTSLVVNLELKDHNSVKQFRVTIEHCRCNRMSSASWWHRSLPRTTSSRNAFISCEE
jgi:hypothetical protein